MKKLIMLSIITSFALSYEGCGVDKKEALNNLSSSIYVSVSNKFKKEEKLSIGFLTTFDKNIKNESTQTSNLTLKNVKYRNKNGKVCAYVSKEDVQKTAKEDLKYLMNFKSNNLPKDFKQKQKTISNLLSKISFTKAILTLNTNQINKLNQLEKNLKDLANMAEVVFNVNIPNAQIKISGIDKTYQPSTPILLSQGEYSYTITAPNKCPVSGEFTIKAKDSFTINKDVGDYPTITFTSNQKNVNTKLNGKNVPLDTPQTLKKCEGKAVWSMSFEDQVENGEIDLEPNMKETINQDFTPKLAMKKLKEKVNYYTKSKEVTINYGYALSDDKEWDSNKRLEIRTFNNYGIYKLGFGILAGTQNSWTAKDMDEFEVMISARVQIPELFDTTLHIYRMPIIPYFGIEGGWDIYKFIDKNYHIDDITSVVRGTMGATFLFHKQFGLNIEYSHDFMEKKDYIFSVGVVLDY